MRSRLRRLALFVGVLGTVAFVVAWATGLGWAPIGVAVCIAIAAFASPWVPRTRTWDGAGPVSGG